jgi:hypothetical protein
VLVAETAVTVTASIVIIDISDMERNMVPKVEVIIITTMMMR